MASLENNSEERLIHLYCYHYLPENIIQTFIIKNLGCSEGNFQISFLENNTYTLTFDTKDLYEELKNLLVSKDMYICKKTEVYPVYIKVNQMENILWTNVKIFCLPNSIKSVTIVEEMSKYGHVYPNLEYINVIDENEEKEIFTGIVVLKMTNISLLPKRVFLNKIKYKLSLDV